MTASSSRGRPTVLLLYADAVGARMGSVGIRAYELAKVLSAHADVTLAAARAEGWSGELPLVSFHPHDPRGLASALDAADVVVAQPQWPLTMRMLERSGARLVFDLYDPETFPTLEYLTGRGPLLRRLMSAFSVDRLTEALRIGDHFVCASEKQRDFLLGAMLAQGVVTPSAYDRDKTFRSIIDVVPFGVEAAPPRRTPGAGIADRFEGVTPQSEVVLWNGGIWNWFDAPTAIRAVSQLAERRPNLRLVFMGATSFGPAQRATAEARTVAAELGVLDRVVFFNDAWVPYDERANWLLDASCALSTHLDHLETRFAFRTRLLDCFWAGLPIVCTAGDELGERVDRDGLGETVAVGDVGGVVDALERVLDRGRDAYAEPLRRAAEDFAWETVAQPLVRYATSEGAPRLSGHSAGGRRVGTAGRSAVYTGARRLLNAVGLTEWPKA